MSWLYQLLPYAFKARRPRQTAQEDLPEHLTRTQHPYMEYLMRADQPAPLSMDEIAALAQEIDVPRANMLALMRQESASQGFVQHSDGYFRPKIRLELHKLNSFTDGMFEAERPDLFKRRFNVNDSHASQEEQYRRLNEALLIIEGFFGYEPALSACSWGLCQVMGFNYRLAGSGTIDRFVARMLESEREQMRAATMFIDAHPPTRIALANRDWQTFARHYNGSARANIYAQQIARNYHIVAGRRHA